MTPAMSDIQFTGHALEWYDENGDTHPGYAPVSIGFDDIQKLYENRDSAEEMTLSPAFRPLGARM